MAACYTTYFAGQTSNHGIVSYIESPSRSSCTEGLQVRLGPDPSQKANGLGTSRVARSGFVRAARRAHRALSGVLRASAFGPVAE